MNKKLIVATLLFFASLMILSIALSAHVAHASKTITITTSSADTTTDLRDPTANSGSSIFIEAQGGPGYGMYGWIKFDLSQIPPGSTLISAQLRLYDTEGQGGTQTVYVTRVKSDWNESALTWNTNAAMASDPTDSVVDNPSNTGYKTFNVTSDVRAFMAGTPNYGWAVTISDGWVTFASREGAPNMLPQLVVEYEALPTKQDVTVALYASSEEVLQNEDITLNSTLSVAASGPVVLQWSINGSGFIYSYNAEMTNGAYSRTFGFSAGTGTWEFRIIWQGNDQYNSATSNEATVNVLPVGQYHYETVQYVVAVSTVVAGVAVVTYLVKYKKILVKNPALSTGTGASSPPTSLEPTTDNAAALARLQAELAQKQAYAVDLKNRIAQDRQILQTAKQKIPELQQKIAQGTTPYDAKLKAAQQNLDRAKKELEQLTSQENSDFKLIETANRRYAEAVQNLQMVKNRVSNYEGELKKQLEIQMQNKAQAELQLARNEPTLRATLEQIQNIQSQMVNLQQMQ